MQCWSNCKDFHILFHRILLCYRQCHLQREWNACTVILNTAQAELGLLTGQPNPLGNIILLIRPGITRTYRGRSLMTPQNRHPAWAWDRSLAAKIRWTIIYGIRKSCGISLSFFQFCGKYYSAPCMYASPCYQFNHGIDSQSIKGLSFAFLCFHLQFCEKI